ncbi:phosphoribosylformylglycinamidine synthase subunit PurS [Campylobacter sp.]|uniref:phosphoribosylformylglycinamidine synthase subunit PurS n=1 Tax=Campylobacter sp. TaxID=205 RepID=UPI0025BDD475|nr:phosphoribosylformylglycinamidine synthase subunit PurS [Campylobacter sp.]
MKVIVNVRLKEGVLDPQGKAVKHALASLGFSGVEDVRVAKQIVLELNGEDRDKIYADVAKMCDEILANTVIEDYEIEI